MWLERTVVKELCITFSSLSIQRLLTNLQASLWTNICRFYPFDSQIETLGDTKLSNFWFYGQYFTVRGAVCLSSLLSLWFWSWICLFSPFFLVDCLLSDLQMETITFVIRKITTVLFRYCQTSSRQGHIAIMDIVTEGWRALRMFPNCRHKPSKQLLRLLSDLWSVWRALRRETQSYRESMRRLWFSNLCMLCSATTALSNLCQGRPYLHMNLFISF